MVGYFLTSYVTLFGMDFDSEMNWNSVQANWKKPAGVENAT
jgi:hypothetical protein